MVDDIANGPVLATFVVFYFFYVIIRTLVHRKERLLMVEKMNVHPDSVVPPKKHSPYSYSWVRVAGLLIGIGFGFLTTYIIVCDADNMHADAIGMLMSALLFVFAGLGMLGGLILERILRKMDEKS